MLVYKVADRTIRQIIQLETVNQKSIINITQCTVSCRGGEPMTF